MDEVRQKFLDVLYRHFPISKKIEDNFKDWEEDYVTALSFYPEDVLSRAAKKLIAEREARSFPLVVECVAACRECFGTTASPAVNYVQDAGPFSSDRIAAAYRMIRSDLGREAAAGDWIIGLWDFCREQGRPPNRFEAEDIKAKQAAHAVTRRGWLDGDPMSPFAAIAAKAIADRQSKLDHLKREAQSRSRAA